MDSCNCPIVTSAELKALLQSDEFERKEQAIAYLVDLLTSRDAQTRHVATSCSKKASMIEHDNSQIERHRPRKRSARSGFDDGSRGPRIGGASEPAQATRALGLRGRKLDRFNVF
jgi:hypothetical protein